MILNLDLTDIWRDLNTECKRFTWHRPTPLKQSRLDFFLISESMVPYVEQTDIQYRYRSDHSMIVLKLLLQKEKMKRKTFWKLNSCSLKDYTYLKEINEEIKNVVEEYAVMLYNRKEIHNIPIFDIQLSISDQLFLDVLLMKIRSKGIAHATRK